MFSAGSTNLGARIVQRIKNMLKNIQAYFRTFGILIPIIFYLFFILKINYLFVAASYFFLFYFFLILYLTYFIYTILTTKKNKTTYFKYISLFSDKEFILFKDSLFKLYGSITIILFIYLFKNGQLIHVLEFNSYFYFILFYLILISNWFILFLFSFKLFIKNFIDMLDNITLEFNHNTKFNKPSIFTLNLQSINRRNLSTSQKFLFDSNNEVNTKIELERAQEAGYFNYFNNINLGSVSQFYDFNPVADKNNEILKLNYLNEKLQDYVNQLPENVKYSVLPVVRSYNTAVGKFKCYPLSYPIKTLNGKYVKSWDSSENFIPIVSKKNSLGYKITTDIFEQWSDFDLEKGSVDLFLLGRPWLSLDDLDSESFFDILECDSEFNEILENFLSELSNVHQSSSLQGGHIKKSFSNNNKTRKFSTSSKFNGTPKVDSESAVDQDNLSYELDKETFQLEKNKSYKEFKNFYKGGYLGYKDVHEFGNIAEYNQLTGKELGDYYDNFKLKIEKYLSEIPENLIYSVLPVLRWEQSDGKYLSITVSSSIKVSKLFSTKILSIKIANYIHTAIMKYGIEGGEGDVELLFLSRPWLEVDEFNVGPQQLAQELSDQLEKDISFSKNSSQDLKASRLKNYLYKDIIMDNYGDPILDKFNNLIGYKITDSDYASVKVFYNDDNLLCKEISIQEFDSINLSFSKDISITWVDVKTDFGFIREYNNFKYYYDKNNNLFNVETGYSFSQFPTYKKDVKFDNKIGTLDFETYGSDFGLGYHQVYAGGWAIEGETKLFYKQANESSEQLVNRLFLSIFTDRKFNGYTFYAHNLGRFDSLFVIKSLILNKNIEITPVWKDNAILSLTLKSLDTKIKILDSLQLISGNLDSILKSFKCIVQKGHFPYEFVNKDNLYYIGDKPEKNFYNNISELEYSQIQNKNWNLKKETQKYLKSDLEGLLEALNKFKDNIYNKYQLNITKYKTISGLALAAYCSSYLPNNLKSELKMIKGELETELRSSYFGGNVDVFINEVTDAYYYDINSQYPKAMLEDMPVGNPVLSLENNLENIFGFVYGEITCPDEQTLGVPFIQYKDFIYKDVVCPRGKFKRLIFSEEIRYALKFGYTIDIEYCYQFKRGKGLFTKYVEDHFEIKSSSKDPVQYSIAKLFLNALYGRMGMKNIEDTMKIVDRKQAETLDKNTNVSVFSELTDGRYLVRYKGKISDRIRKLYKDSSLDSRKNKTITYSKAELRDSGINKILNVPSAIHIAVAISSYARIIINDYKNIPGNPCIMSDTDSAILPKPLPNHLVSKELGKMKLENKINKGIFIRKKLYCILNSNNQITIRSSGVDSSRLNYNSFIKLLKGESLTIEKKTFNVEWKKLNINVTNSKIVIHGLNKSIKTIYNTPDVNYKFISFPRNYSIIVHPLFPMINSFTEQKLESENKINNNNFAKFSTLEQIIIFIFLFSFVSLVSLFLYKIY